MDLPISAEFHDAVMACQDCDPMEILASVGARHGIDNLTYFSPTGISVGEAEKAQFVRTTYPREWCNRYISENYDRVDPVIQAGLSRILPLDWDRISESDGKARDFFGEALEHGVRPRGLTIPLRDADNTRALFTVNVDMPKREWRRFSRVHVADFTYLGFLYHHQLRVFRDRAFEFRLTGRERDVLRWAALGKTSWETARILDLSKKTVEFYLNNATSKLLASNKTQAVAVAISKGLIEPVF